MLPEGYIDLENERHVEGGIPYLIECGVFGTYEAPSELTSSATGISHWQAHMEDLAIVFHIGIVTVRLSLARETVRNVAANRCCVARQRKTRHPPLGHNQFSLDYFGCCDCLRIR